MRPKHGVRLFAAVAAGVALNASPASAMQPLWAGGGPSHRATSQHPAAGSSDLEPIGLGAAAGIGLLGMGLAGARRINRRAASASVASGR